MTGRVFVIADLHLGHEKVARLRDFSGARSHDDALVAAWNRTVGKRDVVYVLGDVFRLDRVPELHGVKKLALGNHDQKPVVQYAALFSKVQACFEFDGCLLTHVPVHPSQFERWPLNVHGHTHAHRINDPRYVPVSVEHLSDMRPAPLRELLSLYRSPTARIMACYSFGEDAGDYGVALRTIAVHEQLFVRYDGWNRRVLFDAKGNQVTAHPV